MDTFSSVLPHVQALASGKLLKEIPRITISSFRFGGKYYEGESLLSIIHAIQEKEHKEALDLSDCRLTDSAFAELFQESGFNLRDIGLENNSLDNAAKSFIFTSPSFSKLESLNLANNYDPWRSNEWVNEWVDDAATGARDKLKKLNLSRNGLGSNDFQKLMPLFSQLETLNLSNNFFLLKT